MSFNEIMALIMPSIIALLLFSKVIKRKITLIEGIGYMALFMLMTNSVCYAILIYLNRTITFVFTNSFTLKYSLLATCLAIIIALGYRFLELNLSINLKVETKDEKE